MYLHNDGIRFGLGLGCREIAISLWAWGGHSKKLQDVFVDAKIPQGLRKTWPVIVGGELPGVILAVPGIAVSEEARAQWGEPVFYIRVD